jgi:hypothetical protein
MLNHLFIYIYVSFWSKGIVTFHSKGIVTFPIFLIKSYIFVHQIIMQKAKASVQF